MNSKAHKEDFVDMESYVTYEDSLRLAGEILSVLGAILLLLLEIPDILRFGAKCYFGQTALGGPFHIILISYACLVVLLCVVRASELGGEDVLMALCLVLGWSNVMFFARGFEMLGPYVIMIQKRSQLRILLIAEKLLSEVADPTGLCEFNSLSRESSVQFANDGIQHWEIQVVGKHSRFGKCETGGLKGFVCDMNHTQYVFKYNETCNE
ncbi:unnamed protein product [Arctogadus glacialis]